MTTAALILAAWLILSPLAAAVIGWLLRTRSTPNGHTPHTYKYYQRR